MRTGSAGRLADALASVVSEFAYFAVSEAREVGRPGLILGPPEGDPAEYRELNLRPAVANRVAAQKFAAMHVAVKVDTGMQRSGCPPDDLDDLVARCEVEDFFSHAVTLEAIQRFAAACARHGRPLHAAATCLLDYPEAWFDAVRPGLALYRGAVQVTARLQSIRETASPVGYTGFRWSRVGIALAGYSNLLDCPGPDQRPAAAATRSRHEHLLRERGPDGQAGGRGGPAGRWADRGDAR